MNIKFTYVEPFKILATIIVIIGWITGNIDGWVAIPLLMLMSDIRIKL